MLALCGLSVPVSAATAADFTWSGASPSSSNWSDASNWADGAVPSGTVGTLSFPALTSQACTAILPIDACYASNNDRSGLSVDRVQLDDSVSYGLTGNGFVLGSGGLLASPSQTTVAPELVDVPITLGASQTWSLVAPSRNGQPVSGGQQVSMGALTGTNAALTVDMSYGEGLGLNGDSEVGPVTVNGANASEPVIGVTRNGTLSVSGSLNSADGHSLTLNHVYFPANGAAVGPLVAHGSEIGVGYVAPATLHAASASFDSTSEVGFDILGPGSRAGTDYAQLTSPGPISLGSTTLDLFAGGPGCHLPTGEVLTLVSTAGALTGAFGNAPNGATIGGPNTECGIKYRINYHEAGSPQTVTATVVYSPQAPLDGGAITPPQADGGGSFCWVCFGKKLLRIFVGAPVDSADGNMYDTATDVSIPGRGVPLAVSRTYNADTASATGPLGHGWVDNLGANLTTSPSTVVLTEENGSETTFTLSGGKWSAPPRAIATLTHNGDGSWTLVRQAQQTLTFNNSGQLTAMSDLNGYTTRYAYSGGVLTTVTDSSGRQLQLGYTGGLLTTVTDPNVSPARVVRYEYNDGAGDLTDVIDVNGGHTHYVYDTAHRLTGMVSPKCYATPGCPGITTQYNSAGQVDSQTDQLGRTTMFVYSGDPTSAAGGTTTITDPKGNVTVETYEYGVRVSETRGYGTPQAATTTYSYDPATVQPVSITDPNGSATLMTYDASGNLLTRTDSLGRLTTYTYNSFNEPLAITDARRVTTTNTYDARGNLTSTSTPCSSCTPTAAQATTYTYADPLHPGDVTAMTDADGKTWKYGYDAYGDRVSTADPLGDKSTSTYNPDGWLLTTVSPRGNAPGANPTSYTTTYSYQDPVTHTVDQFGDARTITDPLGHVTTYGYDPDRNKTSVTDPDGNTTTYTYDAADEQTAVHRADGTTLGTTYWPDGSVEDQIDGAGHITHYDYDPLGRESAVTDPLGRTTSYGYDSAGNETTITDPRGRVTTMTFDGDNELTSTSYSDGSTPNVSNITYDADGQRTGQTDGSGTWAWTWDSLHRLTSVTEGSSGIVSYQYNLRNEPTQITYPGGQVVRRGYDDAGRWTSVTDWLGNTTTFSYDADGNLTTQTLPVGTGIKDSSTYAADGSLSSINDARGTTTLFSANYARDANQQLTGDSSTPAAGSYGYTALNQLCYAGASTATCALPSTGATAYHYDSADNLAQNGSTTETFDAANELTAASPSAVSSSTTTSSTMTPAISTTTMSSTTATTTTAETSSTTTANIATASTTSSAATETNSTTTTAHVPELPHITSGKLTFAHLAAIARRRPIIAQAVSTSSSGDRLLAFVTSANPLHGRQAITGISGGGGEWSQLTRVTSRTGYIAIWQSQAPKRLTRARISVKLRAAGVQAALSVVGFDSSAVVAIGASLAARAGPPHVKLTVPARAIVIAIGRDSARRLPIRALKGQQLVARSSAPNGTSWLESVAEAQGGSVTVGAASPKTSVWALGATAIHERVAASAAVEGRIRPGAAALPVTALSLVRNPLTALDAQGVAGPALASSPASSDQAPTTASDGQLTFSYDQEGDRTGVAGSDGSSVTYGYNQALELASIGTTVAYTYSGDGLRMSKSVGGTQHTFAWDVGGVTPTLLDDGANVYVYGPGGLPLEQVSGTNAVWLHHDQLGSTRIITDATGQVAAAYAYAPDGRTSTATGSASTPLLFAGQYRDAESNLYYLRARYYDPATAQFLSRDPLVPLTRSGYAYAMSDPLNLTDATGLTIDPSQPNCDNPEDCRIGAQLYVLDQVRRRLLAQVASDQDQWLQAQNAFESTMGGARRNPCADTAATVVSSYLGFVGDGFALQADIASLNEAVAAENAFGQFAAQIGYGATVDHNPLVPIEGGIKGVATCSVGIKWAGESLQFQGAAYYACFVGGAIVLR